MRYVYCALSSLIFYLLYAIRYLVNRIIPRSSNYLEQCINLDTDDTYL